MAVSNQDSDSDSDSLLAFVSMSQTETDERRRTMEFEELKRHIRRNSNGSPSSSRSRSPARNEPSSTDRCAGAGSVLASVRAEELQKLGDQVDWQFRRVRNHNCIKTFAQPDLVLSEDELFYKCDSRVQPISSLSGGDSKYHIGVTENPLVRWEDPDMGHSKRYREMHLLGVCGHGEIVGSVEEGLIGERRGIDDNCMNKGKSRERVSRTSRNAKFFYIVIE
jgi:hypothetical protein